MLVQGSPTQAVKMKIPLSDRAFKMARFETRTAGPIFERTSGTQTVSMKPPRKTRWNLSSILVGQCPEFLASFARNG